MPPLAHRAQIVKAGTRHEQPRRWIAHPARFERQQLLGQRQAELST